MTVYKAKITSILLVNNRIDIGGTLLKNGEEFPMPTISLVAESATKEDAIARIKAEIAKFRAGYALEVLLQQYIGVEITLD